jgi:hypothetical protein
VKIHALIDHRNVPWARVSLSRLLEVICTPFLGDAANQVQLEVRAYGGWFEGTTASTERFTASAKYQADLPSLVKVNRSYVRVQFNFADHLYIRGADSRPLAIQGTVVTRASAQATIPIANAQFVCGEPDCEIKKTKRWIARKTACVRQKCPGRFSDYWTRTEQKQVDTHLSCDLIAIHLEGESDATILVSDDLDFIPALATAAMLSTKSSIGCLRFDVLPSYLDMELTRKGVKFLSY